MKEQLSQLQTEAETRSIEDNLSIFSNQFVGKITFSTSFGAEDQVISHFILSKSLPIEIFTLDTGRNFSETYYVWNQTNERYHTKIEAYYPNQDDIQKYVVANGPNAFYDSVELRKQCCAIRKVEPLGRALKGKGLWITGLRAEQSPARENIPMIEWDENHQLFKYNPLLHWTNEDVWKYIRENNIPYNPLHDKGFISIGCAPCTRAIKAGEDFRAGRWWWEDNTKKECGLHIHK